MTKFGKVTFTGESGNNYEFTAYSRDTTFRDVGAVYFMTSRTNKPPGGISHARIYVGQTDSLKRRPLNHERKPCFDQHGANCVCILVEDDEDARLDIETDLRRNYDPPCNQQ